MKHFYGDILSFPIYHDFGTWVEFRVGSCLLTLRKRGTGYDGMREHDGTAPSTGFASVQLAFRVTPAEVQSCYQELQEKNVMIIQAPADQASSGHRTLFFKDPEGNILEIYADL